MKFAKSCSCQLLNCHQKQYQVKINKLFRQIALKSYQEHISPNAACLMMTYKVSTYKFSVIFIKIFLGAIKTINKEMLQFAVRRGLNEEASDNSDGLSGFTETLISAVSRLIIYVNEVIVSGINL